MAPTRRSLAPAPPARASSRRIDNSPRRSVLIASLSTRENCLRCPGFIFARLCDGEKRPCPGMSNRDTGRWSWSTCVRKCRGGRINSGGRNMARENYIDEPASAGVILPSLPSTDGRGAVRGNPFPAVVRPRLRLRILERTALIHIEDAEFLFDQAIVRELGEQLDRLIQS